MHGLSYPQQMSTRYGSAWMLAQQLRVLNAMSTRDVATEVLKVAPSEGRRGEFSSRSLVDMNWYDDRFEGEVPEEGPIASFWARALRERGLDVHAGSLCRVLGRDDVVRWCPECLQFGYHAVWFQLAALSHCPIHELRLEEACPNCGAPNSPCALAFQECGVFECPQCGASRIPVNPARWLRRPDFLAEEERAFGALSRWLRRARSVPIQWHALLRDLHLRGGAEDAAARGAARTAAVLAVVPSRAMEALFGGARDILGESFEEDSREVAVDEYAEVLQRARKQVTLLLDPHAACAAPANALMLGNRKMLFPVVPWESICCVKLAYRLWVERHDSVKWQHARLSLFPPLAAYAALPAGALQRLLVSDFEETVRVLSEQRSCKAISPERLAIALNLDPSLELAGVILPPTEGAHTWWVASRKVDSFPTEACSQQKSGVLSPTSRGRSRTWQRKAQPSSSIAQDSCEGETPLPRVIKH